MNKYVIQNVESATRSADEANRDEGRSPIALTLQVGSRADYEYIKQWDSFWGDRRQELQRGQLFTARMPDQCCVGYVVVVPGGFLNYPLITLLCTNPSYRRLGVARQLLWHVERIWCGTRLFTTTESDNLAMQTLLENLDYERAGSVEKVNASLMTELIYAKDTGVHLAGHAAPATASERRGECALSQVG